MRVRGDSRGGRTVSAPFPTGIHQHIDEDAYHADRNSLSSTGARLLLPPSCPALFRYAMDNARKPKQVWDFGHIFHHLTLGKGAEFIVLDPEVHGLKQDGTVAQNPASTSMWKAEVAKARKRGAVPVSKDDYNLAAAMAKAAHDDAVAGPLFIGGSAEVSMYADDLVTGVQLRARVDQVVDDNYDPGRTTLVDLKSSTTAEPLEFSRKATRLNYHVQDAFYRLVAQLLGLPDPRFLFVAVEKDPPHLVSVVEYDDEAKTEAGRLVRRAIDSYSQCVTNGDWPSYPGTDGVVPISLPMWAFDDDEMEIA